MSRNTGVRIPGELAGIYSKVMSTKEGRSCMKRIRVTCGICKVTKYYSIHRGITRVSSIVACETCRHHYQKFKRNSTDIDCNQEDKGSCYRNMTFVETKCKGCLTMQILDCCPHPPDLYETLSSYLSEDCKKHIRGFPLLQEEIIPEAKGSLGFQICKDNAFVEVDEGGESHSISRGEDEEMDIDFTDDVKESNDSESKEPIEASTCQDKDLKSAEKVEESNSEIDIDDAIAKDDNLTQNEEELLKNPVKEFAGNKDEEMAMSNEDDIMKSDEGECSSKTKDSESLDTVGIKNFYSSESERRPPPRASKEKVTFTFDDEDDDDDEDEEDDEEESSTPPDLEDESEDQRDSASGTNGLKISGIISSDLAFDAEEEALVDDPEAVSESGEHDLFGPRIKSSERIRKKNQKVEYFSRTGGRKTKGPIHDHNGRLIKSGKDLCDCLKGECPGCHFPCPKCRSPKCGSECRVNRRWYFERIEVEGTKVFWTNKFLKAA